VSGLDDAGSATDFSSLNSYFIGCRRFVGDRHSWRLPLSLENLGMGVGSVGHVCHSWLLRSNSDRGRFFIDSS
jgi:hypothetical protein